MDVPQQQIETTEENPYGTSLVVIARDERSVRSTVSFLNRRGIPTKIVTNMNDAVEMFAKKQANMALLSVNYPHPKIEMIPSLFSQSFKIDCILFAEDTDRKSTQKLSSTKARHVLFGPVSGPVVLMRIRQIEKENNQSDGAATTDSGGESSADKASDGSDAIKVGGTKSEHDDRLQVKSRHKNDSDVVASVMKELGEENPQNDSRSRESLQRSGSTIVQKGQRSKALSAEQREPLDKSRRGELSARAFGRAIDQGLLEAPAQKKQKLFIPPPPWTRPELEAEREAQQEAELLTEVEATEAAEASSATESGAELGEASSRSNGDAGLSKKNSQETDAAGLKDATTQASAPAKKPNWSEPPAAGNGGNENQKATETSSSSGLARVEPVRLREPASRQEELFLRCLKEALATVCGEPVGVRTGVSKVRAAGLVCVRSKKVEGAFVIEVGRSRTSPQDFLQRIEVAFFSLLRRAGIELNEGEQFAIELEDFEIVEKAVGASDYLLISVSPDHEVAAAVVPITRPFPSLEPHTDNMLKVDLMDLPVEVPVTFDVFLHLPSNKKYLRYLKVGSRLSGKQSDKLGKKYRVSHMYLNKSDREAYRRHYAAQSIDPKKRSA